MAARLAGRRATGLVGPDAARFFYDEDHLDVLDANSGALVVRIPLAIAFPFVSTPWRLGILAAASADSPGSTSRRWR